MSGEFVYGASGKEVGVNYWRLSSQNNSFQDPLDPSVPRGATDGDPLVG